MHRATFVLAIELNSYSDQIAHRQCWRTYGPFPPGTGKAAIAGRHEVDAPADLEFAVELDSYRDGAAALPSQPQRLSRRDQNIRLDPLDMNPRAKVQRATRHNVSSPSGMFTSRLSSLVGRTGDTTLARHCSLLLFTR
jgi:hypothetical protein